MTLVLIVGLGIQGKKRKKILDQLKIKSISLDPYVSNANYKSLELIPKKNPKPSPLIQKMRHFIHELIPKTNPITQKHIPH